jgi:beta-lactamase superfamily II metal-dependent hydrolase
MIDLMLFFTRVADQIPYSSFTVPSPPLPLLLLFYFLAFFLLSDTFAMSIARTLKNQSSYSAYAGLLALPVLIIVCCLFISTTPMGKQNDAPYTFVDVGQGDCLHIRTRDGRNYLMDGGGKYDYNIGKNILAPYLLKNGVRKLDGVFVSHLHMDHFKGLTELASQIDIGAVYIYDGYRVCPEAVTQAFVEPFNDTLDVISDENLRYLAAGDTVLLGSHARAEVLYPSRLPDEEYEWGFSGDGGLKEDENRTSLIIRFENQSVSVLMTGDVSKEGEAAALNVSDLSCDVLKIGHHGSKSSTSEDFVFTSEPAAAVIQVGKNVYGHPAPETLETLAAFSIPVYRTDESGAVLIRPSPGGFKVQTMKNDLISAVLR